VTVKGYEGYTGEILVHSSNEGVATVTINQETGTKEVTVEAGRVGTAIITISLQEYPGVKKEILVTVSSPSPKD